MLSLLFVAAFAGCGLGLPVNDRFELFKAEYGKEYETQEEHDKRQLTFEHNLDYIDLHNKGAAVGIHTYKLGINKFADLTNTEFVSAYNGHKAHPEHMKQDKNLYSPPPVKALPKAVDWRKEGYVTPVRDQGICGSCWAFSAIGAIEGQHFNATKKLVPLSEQNLVDCDYGNAGCHGGNTVEAFKYVVKNEGVDTEQSYPYHGQLSPCRYNSSNLGATIKTYARVPSRDEKALTVASATVGPISVVVDASLPSFQFYDSGIYHENGCSKKYVDHGMLIVGYGSVRVENGSPDDYWIVKNSWGTSWGAHGYITMRRGNNQCGIATMASFPLAK